LNRPADGDGSVEESNYLNGNSHGAAINLTTGTKSDSGTVWRFYQAVD
jgi:hypothetical protein